MWGFSPDGGRSMREMEPQFGILFLLGGGNPDLDKRRENPLFLKGVIGERVAEPAFFLDGIRCRSLVGQEFIFVIFPMF
jgi:hypothetical protein